jgi:hypothetical protein
MMNVVGYTRFCSHVDAMNGYPVSRVDCEIGWEEVICHKLRDYDNGHISRRWPGEGDAHRSYLKGRALAQVSFI